MMTSRAYHFVASPPSRSPSPSRRPNDPPARPSKPTPPLRTKSSSDRLTATRKLSGISPATPSKPVVIPTRMQSAKAGRAIRARGVQGSEKEAWGHDPNAIPPSMAALLAITAIPSPNSTGSRRRGNGRRKDADPLDMDSYRHSVSSSSPKSWTILQSSPDEYDDEDSRTEKSVEIDTDASSITSNGGVMPSSSLRSFSSESMPSLDIDFDAESTRSISPPTPAQRFRFRSPRNRQPSPAVPLSSDSEHPLATSSFPGSPPSSPPRTPVAEERSNAVLFSSPSTAPTTASFKSNLTASLRLLKSAAKVLSAPVRLHDPSALTVGTASAQRGPNSAQIAAQDISLASRGVQFFLSGNIDALPLHLSTYLPSPVPTMSIELQPCQVSPLTTETASAPPIYMASTNSAFNFQPKKPFQREPRENSDFLRMVVLEMNMRRSGKLLGELGRARIWLGPRGDRTPRDPSSDPHPEATQHVQEVSRDLPFTLEEESLPVEITVGAGGHRMTAGIADGGEGHGAVTLDGEFGEDEHPPHLLLHGTVEHPQSPSLSERPRHVPQRWIPILP